MSFVFCRIQSAVPALLPIGARGEPKKRSQTKPLRLTVLDSNTYAVSGENEAIEVNALVSKELRRKSGRFSRKINGARSLPPIHCSRFGINRSLRRDRISVVLLVATGSRSSRVVAGACGTVQISTSTSRTREDFSGMSGADSVYSELEQQPKSCGVAEASSLAAGGTAL